MTKSTWNLTRGKGYTKFFLWQTENFQAVSFFLCPTFLTANLLSTRQTEIGTAADDLQVDVMTASSVGLA